VSETPPTHKNGYIQVPLRNEIYKMQELRTIYACGSDQVIITGMIPNVSAGETVYILINTQIESGECEIFDSTPISGAIYHVS